MTRLMQPRKEGSRGKRVLLKVLLGLIAIMLVYSIDVGYTIWKYAERTVNIPSDAAIVLGAAVWEGKPSPVFQGRIDHVMAV
ncbi:hypothetical protein ACI2LM_02590 [Paenibacillus lautus]|uniref:hypothetical protein n=1 Tax=Paenibacillus lautus TaxID=1401 RepID=UPI00384D00BA